MCLSPDAHVYAVVYERLRSRGVSERRAAGVARKVQRAYASKRRDIAGKAHATLDGRDRRASVSE
jgi:hypothetical protein